MRYTVVPAIMEYDRVSFCLSDQSRRFPGDAKQGGCGGWLRGRLSLGARGLYRNYLAGMRFLLDRRTVAGQIHCLLFLSQIRSARHLFSSGDLKLASAGIRPRGPTCAHPVTREFNVLDNAIGPGSHIEACIVKSNYDPLKPFFPNLGVDIRVRAVPLIRRQRPGVLRIGLLLGLLEDDIVCRRINPIDAPVDQNQRIDIRQPPNILAVLENQPDAFFDIFVGLPGTPITQLISVKMPTSQQSFRFWEIISIV